MTKADATGNAADRPRAWALILATTRVAPHAEQIHGTRHKQGSGLSFSRSLIRPALRLPVTVKPRVKPLRAQAGRGVWRVRASVLLRLHRAPVLLYPATSLSSSTPLHRLITFFFLAQSPPPFRPVFGFPPFLDLHLLHLPPLLSPSSSLVSFHILVSIFCPSFFSFPYSTFSLTFFLSSLYPHPLLTSFSSLVTLFSFALFFSASSPLFPFSPFHPFSHLSIPFPFVIPLFLPPLHSLPHASSHSSSVIIKRKAGSV